VSNAACRILLLWLATLTLAVGLTALIVAVDTTSEDHDVAQAIQELPLGNAFPNAVRAATTTELDIVVGVAVAAIVWRTGDRRTATVFLALLFVLPLVQHGLKLAVDRPRPPFDPSEIWSDPSSPSFPSGHVMSATVVYGFVLYLSLGERWPPPCRIAARVLSAAAFVLTALTSITLEVHWPTDVLGGYLWGLVLLLPALAVLADPSSRASSRTGSVPP
jgi:membrane-associated phospholipid phosphatase